MAFNRNIYNTRYEIEQKRLPERFFETPKDVIQSLLEPGNNTLYKLFKILIERTGEQFPYKESDFATNCFKFSDGTFGCYVTLPKPESVMLCAHIVYLFSQDLKKLMYFTVESDEFIGHTNYKLCSIDKDGKHYNHGGCPMNASGIIAKIQELYNGASD
ncbi:MAG: hypothetical protein K6A37_08175 [Saccharofermentans sp.]|nr:hypothetical protein [Saccharofermentans sp.]